MQNTRSVRADCARYNPGCVPAGAEIEAKCLKAEGKKCEYFRLVNRAALCETCRQNPAVAAKARYRKAQAREDRLRAGDRICKRCKGPRAKGHTYCESCQQRRRVVLNKSQAKWRKKVRT